MCNRIYYFFLGYYGRVFLGYPSLYRQMSRKFLKMSQDFFPLIPPSSLKLCVLDTKENLLLNVNYH